MNTIHFIGYSAIHPSDFRFEMTTAPGQYTLLLVSTPVQFLLDGQWQEYPAGTAMLYAPGQAVCYRACGKTYQNDWMRFSSDDPLVTQFPLTGSPFPRIRHSILPQPAQAPDLGGLPLLAGQRPGHLQSAAGAVSAAAPGYRPQGNLFPHFTAAPAPQGNIQQPPAALEYPVHGPKAPPQRRISTGSV